MNKETKKGKGEPKFAAAAAAAAAADVILEAMIDGVAIADMNGTVIQCNSGWVKMFGYKSTEEARGRNITEIIIERDIPRCMEGFKDCLEKGIAINFEFTAKDRSGREFPVMLNAVALRDEKGNIVGNVGTLRDITEFKKIQEELQKRINELEEFGKIAVERELDMKKLEEELEKLRGKK